MNESYYNGRFKCGKCGNIYWTHPWLSGSCCGMAMQHYPATDRERREIREINYRWSRDITPSINKIDVESDLI